MSKKMVGVKAFGEWVDALAAKKKVVGVQAKEDRFAFLPLRSSKQLRLDYDVTILPPKQFFQPAVEPMMTFEAGKGFAGLVEGEPFVLFGVHPYDFVAIRQMDRLFEESNCDTHYFARREKATIVVVDPQAASQNVFAGAMNNAHVSDGYDVLLTKIGDNYLVDAASAKGEELVSTLSGAKEAGAADIKEREKVWKANEKKLVKHDLKAASSRWPALLEKGYDSALWEERAKLCFSCGSCNLVCPTCYCFDVKDEVDWSLKKGARVRTWDGCMLAGFAEVAGKHNFRKNSAARYRHRYLRKGAYVPGKLGGEIACVGCGRCIGACVAKIANPVEIFNKLLEVK